MKSKHSFRAWPSWSLIDACLVVYIEPISNPRKLRRPIKPDVSSLSSLLQRPYSSSPEQKQSGTTHKQARTTYCNWENRVIPGENLLNVHSNLHN